MEHEVVLRQIEEVEQKIEKLIEANNHLKNENSELKLNVEGLQEQLNQKIECETNYLNEKSEIKEKIDIILGKLVQIA